MAWQTTEETARIIAIGIAVESAAIPTLPTTGTAIDWTETATGEDMYGWTVLDADLTDAEFTFNMVDNNDVEVSPPTAQGIYALIRNKRALKSITCTAYEVMAKVYALATNVTTASLVYTESATFTRAALLIEYEGLGVLYCPSVEIGTSIPGGGVTTLSTQEITIDAFANASYPAAYSVKQYTDAA